MGPGFANNQRFMNQRGPAVNPFLAGPGRTLNGGLQGRQSPFMAGRRPAPGFDGYRQPVSGFNRGMMVGGGMLP